ncbi:MAG TPA: DoxX family membrane protein [Candidatus Limnocylindria bacterium]|nr:DoxX family membrane protein [Candidatus Limnocylindria bacterium]
MSTMRNLIYVLAVAAAVSLGLLLLPELVAPEMELTGVLRTIVTWIFWISFIALAFVLFRYRNVPEAREVEVEGPGFARFLFNNSAAGLFWLPIRLFVGVSWLSSGLGKLGNPAWTEGGTALRGYWTNAVNIPEEGRPPITYEWYRDFINTMLNANAETWFSWLVILGEIAVGLGLILGILTGIAAFFGALMNVSFMLAGTASTNPVLFTLAIGLILAWKVAGYYGVDRWLLPRLGTPWRPGELFAGRGWRTGTGTGTG